MPTVANPFNGSNTLGEVFKGIANEWFNPPERRLVRLREQEMQQRMDDRYNARLEDERKRQAALEFWNQWKELTVPQPVQTTPGAYAPAADGQGPYLEQGSTPMSAPAAQEGDMLGAVFSNPTMMQAGTTGGVFDVPGLMRAQEARMTREDNQKARADLAEQNNRARADLAAQNAQARAAQIAQTAGFAMDRLQAQIDAKRAELELKMNDPLARAKLESEIALLDQRKQTERGRYEQAMAHAGYYQARTQTELANPGGTGGTPMKVTPNDADSIRAGLDAFISQSGIEMTPEDYSRALIIGSERAQASRNIGTASEDWGSVLTVTPGDSGSRWNPFDGTDPTYSFVQPTPQPQAFQPPGPVAAAPPPPTVAPPAAQIGQQPVRVNTPEEAAQLPPGTRFITPEGEVRVRK